MKWITSADIKAKILKLVEGYVEYIHNLGAGRDFLKIKKKTTKDKIKMMIWPIPGKGVVK